MAIEALKFASGGGTLRISLKIWDTGPIIILWTE
jgi:hypothetical protein